MRETQSQTVQVQALPDDLAFLDVVTEWDTTTPYHQWRVGTVVPETFLPGPVPRVITVANQKGGTGKTSTALELALAFVARGLSVRLIDADPQAAGLTHWLPCARPDGGPTLVDLYFDLKRTIQDVTYPTPYAGLYLVPSLPDLDDVQARNPVDAQNTLRHHLRKADDGIDVTIIDSGPSLGTLTVSALVAAHEVVIPVQASSGLDVVGMAALNDTIEVVKDRPNPELRVAAVILTDFEKSTLARDIGAAVAAAYPDALLVPARTSVKLGAAQLQQMPLRFFDPKATTVMDYDRAAGLLLAGRGQGAAA
ncbi:ParA family protein [Streptomyces sp. NPDC002120]|uniref:ParA family protein n=1 Tax=Streptomyces sp. NPDC002120 TaxID=3364631 RepID=UPI0036985BE2